MLSNQLLDAVEASLQRGEQSLLYLNRRGTARVALCQQCGWQALCPHCDLPLTFHGDQHSLRCHTCGRSAIVPTSCPVCGSPELSFKGFGTKAVVEEISRRFPGSRIMRFDSDNTAAERLEKHYPALKRGDIDIIVGTQAVAKGLDLPRLSTLGVLMADSGLSLPDYTSVERTYQLVSQVIGRAHRGHRDAHAIVQTFNPDNSDLLAALHDNWGDFYNRELAHRREYHFPPFRQLLVIRCRRASAASAEKACLKVADHIRNLDRSVEIDGPAPAFHERSAQGYTWQLIIKTTDRASLLTIVDQLPATVSAYDLDPLNLL